MGECDRVLGSQPGGLISLFISSLTSVNPAQHLASEGAYTHWSDEMTEAEIDSWVLSPQWESEVWDGSRGDHREMQGTEDAWQC